MTPDVLAIGHITVDLSPQGAPTPGGTVLYAATTALRLGLRPAILSAAPDAEAVGVPPGVAYAATPSPVRSTFANTYTPAGRIQMLHAAGAAIALDELPVAWRSAPLVLLAPVFNECAMAWVAAFPHALIAATPQGWMRAWDLPLPAPVRRVPWKPDPIALQRLNVLVLSEEDLGGDVRPVAEWAQYCRCVALTRGRAGATLFVDGTPHAIPAVPAIEHDPTGAGDVFATALLIRLFETGDPLASAHFAAAVAARSVEGSGTTAIPARESLNVR